MFLWLVSIALRSWNADDREDVRRTWPARRNLRSPTMTCRLVMWILPFLRLPHWGCGPTPDKLCEVDCVGGIHCFCASFAVIFHVSHA